jgi:hypothetical protein
MAQTADHYAAVLSASEGVLDDVERALARLDDGTYGVCEACGGPIDHARLDELPVARTCAGHPRLTDPAPTGPSEPRPAERPAGPSA